MRVGRRVIVRWKVGCCRRLRDWEVRLGYSVGLKSFEVGHCNLQMIMVRGVWERSRLESGGSDAMCMSEEMASAKQYSWTTLQGS
jgi:hypothetical protein